MIGGICIVLFGSTFFVLGMYMLDWNFLNLDTIELSYGVWDSKVEQVESLEIESIKVNTNVNFKIVPSQGDSITVDYFYNEKINFNIEVVSSNNELVIDFDFQRGLWNWRPFYGLKVAFNHIELALPVSFSGGIDIMCDNANVNLEKINSLDLNISNNNGNVNLKYVKAQSIYLKNDNGSTHLNDIDIEGNLRITSKNGRVNLANIVAEQISLQSENGNVKLDTVDCLVCEVNSVNGKIDIYNLDSFDIKLSTKNGNINVSLKSLKSDYQISVTVSNGNSNVSEQSPQGANRKLSLSSSNGKINVQFEA